MMTGEVGFEMRHPGAKPARGDLLVIRDSLGHLLLKDYCRAHMLCKCQQRQLLMEKLTWINLKLLFALTLKILETLIFPYCFGCLFLGSLITARGCVFYIIHC